MTYEGTIFTSDPITNLLVINTATPTAATGDYHIIPVSRLQSINIISVPGGGGSDASFVKATPPIGPLNIASLRAREETAVRRLQQQQLKQGKNVTAEAQEIFNALDRTMPVKWAGQDIIISDNVLISKPYRTDDCRALDDTVNGSAVQRVRKVVSSILLSIKSCRS